MNDLRNTEKLLKSSLKGRVKLTLSAVVSFLIIGTAAFGAGVTDADYTGVTGLIDVAAEVAVDINANGAAINANTAAITAETGLITTNTDNITTNTDNITTNTDNITTNTDNITTNTDNITTNTDNIATNTTDIATNAAGVATNASGITSLGNQLNNLDEKLNQGMSLLAAMDAIDFKNVEEGEMAFGVGTGYYGNSQAVAVGVAYAPTENLNVNAKYSLTTGSGNDYAAGVGAVYKFKLGN